MYEELGESGKEDLKLRIEKRWNLGLYRYEREE